LAQFNLKGRFAFTRYQPYVMKYFFSLTLLFLCLGIQAQVKITYIANEGVLIQSGDQKVIIDALFDKYYDDYLHPSEDLLETMIAGEAPYNNVNLLLSTHVHRDHFAPTVTGRFLKGHPETRLISSAQLAKSLADDYAEGASITAQTEGIVRDEAIHERTVEGIKVHAFFIYHAGGSRTRSIENMGYIVELGGLRILHLGDSDMNPERFAALDLKSLNIDIAMVPYWYMADETGVKIINESIQPKHLLGIHFPILGSDLAKENIAKNFPEAHVLTKVHEERSY